MQTLHSPTARALLTLVRVLELDQRRTFTAAIDRAVMQTRCRLLADRLIQGRA